MAVMFQVEVFWVVTPCNDVVGYQCFRDLCCLHLQGEVSLRTVHTTQSYISSPPQPPTFHYPNNMMSKMTKFLIL